MNKPLTMNERNLFRISLYLEVIANLMYLDCENVADDVKAGILTKCFNVISYKPKNKEADDEF